MLRRPTSDLAHFCATLHGDELPAHARERVRYLLLDHLAVTLGGSRLPSSQAVYSMLQHMRATGSTGTSTIFGRPERAEASWAAFANGVAAHGLEMDDVENASSLHPGVVVMPTCTTARGPSDCTPAGPVTRASQPRAWLHRASSGQPIS